MSAKDLFDGRVRSRFFRNLPLLNIGVMIGAVCSMNKNSLTCLIVGLCAVYFIAWLFAVIEAMAARFYLDEVLSEAMLIKAENEELFLSVIVIPGKQTVVE